MAGISVPQYEVFKLGTDKLKYYDWNIKISKKEAFRYQELVSLFESQAFRLIANKIIKEDASKIDFSTVFAQIVIDKKTHFARATSKKGIVINGEKFLRFVGTNGGLKNNTLIFCNEKYIKELNRLCECDRDPEYKLVPAKYESYKALTCSASQPICEPNGILVVRDCFADFVGDVIELGACDVSDVPSITKVDGKEFHANASDGYNLCTVGYMDRVKESLGLDYRPSGVCLRNAWTKGMMYAFPIVEFFDKYGNGNYMVEDVWGNMQDVRQCEMILTESSLKLSGAYKSIDDYIESYKANGYGFSITKIATPEADEQRELNYQYLQSYEFTDDDIKELCEPTIKYLKDSMGNDYSSVINFLGINQFADVNSWQKALYTSEYMLGDPYIIDCVHRYIKKQIDGAKIGKLFVNGNYQLASGDPVSLMQSLCGLPITGLLKSGQCYSSFWVDKNEESVIVFRSPMTSHANIRNCEVNSTDDAKYWYQYMPSIMIINSFDTFCIAENGCDYDGDLLFSTNNPVLKRRHRVLPAIECAQNNTTKVIVNDNEIKKTNKNGMGNKVGVITNRVTSMMEVQARFDKDSPEYKELAYRITCGQTYQQNEIDKIKGIIAKPMPNSWYNLAACGDDRFLQSICADKKPYFFIYVYDEVKQKYKNYIKENEEKCINLYGCSIDELKLMPDLDDDQKDFLFWYDYKMPIGVGNCAMNRICNHVENEMNGYKSKLRKNSTFDYNILKTDAICEEEHIRLLDELETEYCNLIKDYKNSKVGEKDARQRLFLAEYTRKKSIEVCPDDEERLNIILDLTYGKKGNKQFCWDVVGELIVNRLERLGI